MNKKAGLYIGAIALAAIALIATISFNSFSEVRGQEGRSQAEAIIDLKWEMQNAQYLTGKSIADALADATYDGGACTYNSTKAKNTITSYLGSGGLSNAMRSCGITINSINTANQASITVEAKFNCLKDSGSLDMDYKKTITFKKAVSGTGCAITVTDLDTGQQEVGP